MKTRNVTWVHTLNGTEHEAPEGTLNWPWVPKDTIRDDDKYADTRARAREYVEASLEEAKATAEAATKRGPGRPRKGESSPDA